MNKKLITVLVIPILVLIAIIGFGNSSAAAPFDGAGDNQTDVLGYYYIITGGKFPTGTTPNGDNASGGTFRFILDDPAWGYTIDSWQKDDWFAANASFALTLKSGTSIVYDNNGIEDGSYGNYYNAAAQGLPNYLTPGLYRGYSNSNNFDWIYAGYFKITEPTTFDQIIGYFDPNGSSADPVPFNPNSHAIRFRMNIWSNVTGNDLLPINTGSFTGDVFSTDFISGTFSWSDTGADRVYQDYSTDDIYRLVFTPSSPFTLQPGIYWFSHDAAIVPVATNKEACKKLGWQSLIRADYSTFKNQGDCIQYVNTGK